MTDFYLNTETQETYEALEGASPLDYAQGGFVGSQGWSVDVIGGDELKVVGWTKEGEPVMEPVGGYLVNLRSDRELPAHLKQYQVYPATPIRVWA